MQPTLITYTDIEGNILPPSVLSQLELFVKPSDNSLYGKKKDGTVIPINTSGGSTSSFANFYKTGIQIIPVDTNITFDSTAYFTPDIVLAGSDITINNTGYYKVTVKTNDNSADLHVYQLKLNGVTLPQSVNGKTNIIIGLPADQNIQVETIISCIIKVDVSGWILNVNAPIGCGLDTAPLPVLVPPVIKASIVLQKIGDLW